MTTPNTYVICVRAPKVPNCLKLFLKEQKFSLYLHPSLFIPMPNCHAGSPISNSEVSMFTGRESVPQHLHEVRFPNFEFRSPTFRVHGKEGVPQYLHEVRNPNFEFRSLTFRVHRKGQVPQCWIPTLPVSCCQADMCSKFDLELYQVSKHMRVSFPCWHVNTN